MFLKSLFLRNFRNYEEEEILWHPRLNLITGFNAQGKSNLLEAIGYLSIASSFRRVKDKDLIRWNQSFFYIEGDIQKKSANYLVSIGALKDKKKVIKINGNKRTKISDIFGVLNSVIFSPEDLAIVKSSPSARRRYLDSEMIQLFPAYYHLLVEYQKILIQKNNILKSIRQKKSSKDLLIIWDEQLIEVGSKIIKKRLEVLQKLTPLARLMHRKITYGEEELEIIYEGIESSDVLKKSNVNEIKEIFSKKISSNRNNEIARGLSLIGPHRDDLKLVINNIDIRKFGSQGQQRTTALSLKLAELELMKAETAEYPILLLDDVMSELDQKRRSHLLEIVGPKIQTFITTTEVNFDHGEHKKFYISQGKLKNIE